MLPCCMILGPLWGQRGSSWIGLWQVGREEGGEGREGGGGRGEGGEGGKGGRDEGGRRWG